MRERGRACRESQAGEGEEKPRRTRGTKNRKAAIKQNSQDLRARRRLGKLRKARERQEASRWRFRGRTEIIRQSRSRRQVKTRRTKVRGTTRNRRRNIIMQLDTEG
ncbi:hypothetical protein TGGT1_409280 [Toxoplasma gondii GT1]|uniref:Uncharacterized protein n=1 Tax=Toxoplasma gondii (strain ATCC 50853 / GT1) TaxID=507601 RepID=S7UUJ0_TOXGG|nr:hypothetical protein TGGT1_409280 [Toxoplasma gondii GT1]